MSDVQIAVIDQQDTQIVLAVPGVQGATGSSIPSGGTTDQVLRKNSSTDYDANWAQVTSAMIANGTIVNDDINNSAAIAGTKISPDFGGQAVTTTGQVSAARVNVTNNTPPSNGIYLPSANNVAISTGGTGRLFVDASGRIGLGTALPTQKLHIGGTNPGDSLIRQDTTTGGTNWEIGEREAGKYQWWEDDNDQVRMTLTSQGSLGIGTTSPGSLLDVRGADGRFAVGDTSGPALQGGYSSGGSVVYLQAYDTTSPAFVDFKINGSSIRFGTGASATECARIDSSGRLLVGTSTSDAITNDNYLFQVRGASANTGLSVYRTDANASPPFLALAKSRSSGIVSPGDNLGAINFVGHDGAGLASSAASIAALVDGTPGARNMPGRLVFSTTADGESSPTPRMRINSQGSVYIGGTGDPGAIHIIQKPGVAVNTHVLTVAGSDDSIRVYNASAFANPNGAAMVLWVRANDTTSRSINAAGTVNAGGTDYAEYMTKAGDFTIAKGDVCGVTADGQLTNEFADAVSFVVKSTNPSYVGGDTWGAGFDDDPEGLEVARQTVDRIAFAGQVPVNVMGATPGQYIVPSATEDGGISGIAKGEAEMTLAEYMQAIGKVIAIEDDGRARIIVKVA